MMKKIIFVLALLGLLLVSCASSGEADITPTTPPTKTPPPPTSTPKPTATPTSPPPTPTPTPEPTLILVDDIMEELGYDDLPLLIQAERSEFDAGYYRWAIGLSNSIIERDVGYPPMYYMNRASSYARLGEFEKAIEDLNTAVQIRSLEEPGFDSGLFNNLCWYLAITGEAEQALPHCEQAVIYAEESDSMFNPAEMIIDSRGVVYGMLGRTDEAIADFEQVLAWGEENPFGLSEEMAASRQQWLDALEQGQNPFKPDVLEQLRLESIDPLAYPEPEMLEDYSRQHFVGILKQDGFTVLNSGVNDYDIEYEGYSLNADGCFIGVVVFGPEDSIWQSKMMLNGCSEEQFIGEMRWFAKLLMLNNPREDIDCIQMGEWFAWELTELQNLVNGEIDETEEVSIGGIDFIANREEDSETGDWIFIFGY